MLKRNRKIDRHKKERETYVKISARLCSSTAPAGCGNLVVGTGTAVRRTV